MNTIVSDSFRRTRRKFSDLRYETRTIYVNNQGFIRIHWFHETLVFVSEEAFAAWLSRKHLEEVVVPNNKIPCTDVKDLANLLFGMGNSNPINKACGFVEDDLPF